MGLKRTNYISKSTGVVIPQAYAILKNLIIETNNDVRAIFSIQASREAAKTYKPLDTHEIRFAWDRKSDPVKKAYEVAKNELSEFERFDENGNKIKNVEYGLLYGWVDDIAE